METKKVIKRNRLLKVFISALAILIAGVFALSLNMPFFGEVHAVETQEATDDSNSIDNTDNTDNTDDSDDTGDTDNTDDTDDSDTTEGESEAAEEVDGEGTDYYTIRTAEDLVNFSGSYDSSKQNIRLQFYITGNLDISDEFISIGTQEAPFNGEIVIDSDLYTFILNKPLFAYINDSVKITDGNGNTMPINIQRNSETDTAVFAENVLHNADNIEIPEWRIKLSVYYESETPNIYNSSSVIGTLSSDAAISLFVMNNASVGNSACSIASSGNAGLACGTMMEYSSLSVIIAGTNTSFSVTSSDGNAGGLVGEMKSGSTLTIQGSFTTGGIVSAENGYAGGLVGYASNSSVNLGGMSISSNVKGSAGTGGIFGYYEYSLAEKLTISRYNVSTKLSGVCCGGIFGKLVNSGEIEITASLGDTLTCDKTDSDKNDYGGFIGEYYVPDTAPAASLTITGGSIRTAKTGTARYYGGIIGYINSSAYVKLSGVTVNAEGCISNLDTFGGVIGYCDKGFIDVGSITVSVDNAFSGGGIAGNMNTGILRFSGTTDLSGAKPNYTQGNNNINGSIGQIAAKRDRALICAAADWKLIRCEDVPVDDITSWGEVVRFSDKMQETGVYDYDSLNHTITLKSASCTVNSLSDFAVLALNIQLNNSNTNTGKLLFAPESSTSATLLDSDITFNEDIDLRGTGITGLTRDNGTNSVFTGSIDGKSHTLTLAIGEAYGFRDNDSTPVEADSLGNGAICRHKYNGLVASTGSNSKGAVFKDLTISGSVNLYVTDTGGHTYIGGATAAHETNSITLENVSALETITTNGSGSYIFIGGLIGRIQENRNDLVISINGGTMAPDITNRSSRKYYLSGIIGEISTNNQFSVELNNITVSAKITDNCNDREERTGGLISNIANYNGNTDAENRTISITDVVFDDTVIESASTNKYECGGLFGETWNNTHVIIGGEARNGVTIRNSTLSVINSGSADVLLGGLCTAATGFWQVYDVNIEGITVNAPYAGSFGMLVNKSIHTDYNREFALYLELEKENSLRISAAQAHLENLNENAVFDELVATCMKNYSDDIAANNRSVISIHTSGGKLITDGINCNTYQNQTGRNTTNINSRYYYNLDVIRNNADKTPAEKLLIWSLSSYAYSNIKKYFVPTIGNSIPANNYNFAEYSYYPIDVSSAVTISTGSTFNFCNREIENGENGSGNTDSTVRSTTDKRTQHYLMHCGLFRNVNADLTVEDTVLTGSIGECSVGSGALICGLLSGSVDNTLRISISNILLNGIKVDIKNGSYAPLLINRISSYTKTTIDGISTGSSVYSGVAATSLIGEIGNNDSGDAISLTFKNIALDGRKAPLANAAANSAHDTAYGTTSSVFSKATLIHSFSYPDGNSCTAVYNYKFEEDWNADDTPLHNVTYGKEVSHSVEFVEEGKSIQREYINQYFTNPEEARSLNGDYDFSACFLPYTATAYGSERYHEIRVNHKNTASLSTGCGTYNDPYIITRASQLSLVASILAGNTPTSDGVIINYHANNYNTQCSGHTSYIWNSDEEIFKVEDGSATISISEIISALSTAYYTIAPDSDDNSINLPADFVGIGRNTDFKGVICGKLNTESDPSPKIIINNISPFIYRSAGSVVKNLDITVNGSFTATSYNGGSKYLTDDNGSTYFYGGVMGIVKGGDNIIDKVSVNIVNSNGIFVDSGSYNGNVAIGGYVGVIRYGAVIFRNMGGISNSGITSSLKNSFTPFTTRVNDFKDSAGKVRLYLNPIIGRVIDGYAFTESDSYKPLEADVTMHNGIKNYSIADIDKYPSGKISFGAFSDIGKNSVKKSTVTVPDSQTLFLMGCIAMSGSGSAELNGAYPVKNDKPKYSYGEGMMTRHGNYNDIGTTDSTDFTKTSLDNYSNSINAVPYIIYKYTDEWSSDNSVKYPARSLTNNSCTYSIILNNSGYTLPEGFRGIGSLSSSSEDLEMYINAIEGNNATINLNMHFYHYRSSYEQYYKVNDANNIRVGLGLFNALIQNRGRVTQGDITSNVISNLTISGTLEEISYHDEGGSKNYDFYVGAGGLAGSAGASENTNENDSNAKCRIQVKNVQLNNLSAYSHYTSGGLFGATRIAEINASAISGSSVSAWGYFAGGIIGLSTGCNLNLDNSGQSGIFRNINAYFNGKPNNFNSGYGIGSLVGTVLKNKTGLIRGFLVENSIVSGENCSGSNFAGGIVGVLDGSNTVTLSDITLRAASTTNAKGGYNGGIVGTVKKGISRCYITNCHLIGGADSIITGSFQAGGIVGLASTGVTIDGCSVKNYTIGAGSTEAESGFIAKAEFVNTTILKNSLISDCIIRQGNSAAGGIVGHCTGGMVINGYNIVLDNLQITDLSGNSKASHSLTGDIVGNMDNSACEINLVGLSVQMNNEGIYAGKNAGTNIGKMHLIFADYEGKCLEAQKNEAASQINTADNVSDMGASPFATVNPVIRPDGTTVLTGDGISSTALSAILSDIEAGTAWAYKNAEEDAEAFSGFIDKLSTFNDKTGQGLAGNFPVLVVNDSNINIKKMLNSYIHLLTNNKDISDYAASDSRFTIDIASYRLNDSGIFERHDEVDTLIISNGYFRMTDTYDSGFDGQFTLIDIGYKSPEDISKIAYHLYIPVYVEKMLKFDFRIAALSGTRYNSSLYKDICGLPVLENYGTPVTAYATYSYLRTADEWADAINGGEKLMNGYGKSVLLNEHIFPDGTKIALVDRNRNGKVFYSTIEAAFNRDNKLDFGVFTDSDGAAFSPVSLSRLLEKSAAITASPDENGNLILCSETDPAATVKIGEAYYRKRKDSDTDVSAYCSVTVAPKAGMTDSNGILILEENYYLSFFTPENNTMAMRNIPITCGNRLGDSGMTPSRLNNSRDSKNTVRIILGNLYRQSFTFETSGNEIINSDNRTITASLRTEISLKPDNAQQVKGYLQNSSIHLYHGFIIDALRTEDLKGEKGVKGNPRVYGTYSTGSADYPIDFNCTDSSISIVGKNGSNAVDIKNILISNDSVVITCDNLKISYDEDTSIIEQFPERKTENSTNGVTYSAVSNLAYVEDNILHSNISADCPDNNSKNYYRKNISTVSMNYDIPAIMPNELTNCGINGLETNGEITAVGYYNVVNIPEEDMNRAESVKLTLSLYIKNEDGTYSQVDIDDFLENVTINANSVSETSLYDGRKVYSIICGKNDLSFEASSFEIPTTYSVITGSDFEASLRTYSNYRVMLEAQLLDGSRNSIDNTVCSDYIIYTNAKIFTGIITAG